MEDKPKIRKHIDKYIVFEEKLGAGQFSTVYKAMDKTSHLHNFYYAVKQIAINKINLTQQPQQKDILQKEIDILLKCKHQNLIQLHDMKQSSNNLYLVLDYCNGGDLKSYIQKKGGRLSEDQAVQFFKELCAGYKVLHEQNIIHRDLKPENTLLHNDHVKIGDFGFARIVSGDMNNAIRMTQKCSPLYAPPQLLSDKHYSSKCDVFSMGVMFYEILYGVTPFIAQTIDGLEKDMHKKLVQGTLQFPTNIKVADVVKDCIIKMLQYEEVDRISWDQLFQHEIFNYTPFRLIDFEFDVKNNEVSRSIEKARTRTSLQYTKKQFQEEKNNMNSAIEEEESNVTEPQSQQLDNEDDLFGNYMQQIQQKEQADKVVKKIDLYFHFIKNRALFTNTALINFWNSFQKDTMVKAHVKCQVLICLSGYHYFNLLGLEKIICKQTQQTVFKQETFNAYCESSFYKSTQEQVIENVKNAEVLYNELHPLCIKEFQNSLQNDQISQQEKLELQQFMQQINNSSQSQGHEIYINYFPSLIPKVFELLNIDSPDLDIQTLQSLFMILIFSNMNQFFPSQNYADFDFQLFEEDRLINVQAEQLRVQIKQTIQQFHQKQ